MRTCSHAVPKATVAYLPLAPRLLPRRPPLRNLVDRGSPGRAAANGSSNHPRRYCCSLRISARRTSSLLARLLSPPSRRPPL